MAEYNIHYPNFNVLREEEHWDPHTRKIVNQRLETQSFYPYQFFTQQEADTLSKLCSILLDDPREQVIAFVVHHFDSSLKANLGESQRKVDLPKQSTLIREGLAQLDWISNQLYSKTFINLEETVQKQIVNQLIQGKSPLPTDQRKILIHHFMDKFMDKILNKAVAAYYSHPAIWSEIGYAGPAYPRGYVRSELGLTDPWEAKRDGK